jgi:hypothetical protein
MSEPKKQETNRHAVTDPELCEEMAQKYGWNLLGVEDTGVKDLPYDCVFEGEQTSFEDIRYEEQ